MSRLRRLLPGRRVRRTVAVLTALLALVVGSGIPVYVRPQIDELRRADALLILGGYDYGRYVLGLQLAEEGWAPNVVVSNPNGRWDRWLTNYCAAPHPTFTLHCFVPDPKTTSGESREFGALAAQNGWRTAIVVTFRPHVSRARYIVGQCFHGDLIMVASPSDPSLARWVWEYGYQTAGYIKAVLQPAC